MFGSHLSIAGGMHNALLDAEKLSMETVQAFTKNWVTPHPTMIDGSLELFRRGKMALTRSEAL